MGIMNPAKTVCRNRVFRDGTGGFMEQKYDVIIIGAGPGGIFCAYELMEKNKDLKVLMVEKGRPIEKRTCPKRKTKVCVGCKPCSITTGFAGAGAFPTVSFPCHLMWEEICRKSLAMNRQKN